MKSSHSLWLHTAAMLQAQMLQSRQAIGTVPLPATAWSNIVKLARQVELAQQRSWHLAAQRQAAELLAELESLQFCLAEVSDQLRERLAPRIIASPAELYRDLAALAAEFEMLQCDLESQTVSVTTGPIVLEGIALGRFLIRLDLKQFPKAQQYAVVALQPNPASSDSNITHPHVNDEALCAGDGLRAIRSALATGRLYDFFTIVHQTLQTYAQGRAYVELENWHGMPCHDCNSTVDEEERYRCHRCEEVLCGSCADYCSHCDETCCSGCSVSCPRCDGLVCAGCLQTCHECRHEVCPDCLHPNLCTQCQNHEPEPDEVCPEDQEASPPVSPEAAVQPHSLGQAPILA